ncbi:MAG: heavy-metal-associated domain-containing protein [Deltaproteobacteria bacterium]|nr:heavy-metal-associated domain-containing protein [Deltaproteobacteria bacterium]MBW2563904.1 heavy-metal-associated domain-containing protein [Deltaproteobacteria bacterium]
MKHNQKIIILAITAILILFQRQEAFAGDIKRTTLLVSNLVCVSCLSRIEIEVKSLVGTIGMVSNLQKRIVTVDHKLFLGEKEIAEAITGIGYPARIISTTNLTKSKAVSFSQGKKYSRGSCGAAYCNAAASSWKKLFRRYLSGKK